MRIKTGPMEEKWSDEEYKKEMEKKRQLRKKMIDNTTEINKREYAEQRSKVKPTTRSKMRNFNKVSK